MRTIAVLFAIPWLLLAGCDSCAKGTAGGGSPASPSAAPSASAPVAAPSGSVAPSGKMAHCPNAVPSARTFITDVPGGVLLSVSGTDPASIADVRARTTALLDAQKNQGGDIRHTGTGEGGGLLGRCPVVLKDTTVTAADSPDGVKVTVAAKNPEEVDWLRRETREREEDLQTAGSPAGAGKMANCPSAVQGAVTALRNLPDGVSVVVTAPADDAVKMIRERSKHLVEVAVMSTEAGAPASEATHTGAGGGGGTVGRCPIVVKDTVLKVTDVPGGSRVDVRTKGAAAIATLQAEAKERAQKFQLGDAGADAAATR
jgi:TusA-related sulfurtransferase